MIFSELPPAPDRLFAAIQHAWLADEAAAVQSLLARIQLDVIARKRIDDKARQLVAVVREKQQSRSGLDAFLREYDLSSQEGVVLMCIAEALLRIPDTATADRLIRDKIAEGDWEHHLGHSHSLWVNASTWGLMLTGRLVAPESDLTGDLSRVLKRLVARSGEPVIRRALEQAMRILGQQFVMGQTIELALERTATDAFADYRFSFDMLGEAALTRADADRYFRSYRQAVDAIGRDNPDHSNVYAANSISIKLSALHPRFEYSQRERVLNELTPKVLVLAEACRNVGIGLTIDAEEADRLTLTLEIFEKVIRHRELDGWNGCGLAIQAYQKRAIPVIEWLADLARQIGRRIPIRLVKGAYWDTEIKRAQEQGLDGYPVFARKEATDVSYLACATTLLDAGDIFYPQFATHNAHTAAAIIEMAGGRTNEFEFQRLHGMGEDLHAEITAARKNYRCRIYAPVGDYQDLLPYLVRRLLENGANTSFVNRIANEEIAPEEVITDPLAQLDTGTYLTPAHIPLPVHIFGNQRLNSRGCNLADESALWDLAASMNDAMDETRQAQPIINGKHLAGDALDIVNPADHRKLVGRVINADKTAVDDALEVTLKAFPTWNATRVEERAQYLGRAAELFEKHRAELVSLCISEGGKSIGDAVAEVREAVDYCRYYAMVALNTFAEPQALRGPTGESNELTLHGRGVFVCISPWNFPLAIFVGQISAALVAGNTVIAKPAEQTPLIAARAIELLHQAGIPAAALNFVTGPGEIVGAQLCADPRVSGVAFTGSTEVAWSINRALAGREAPVASLIAETGGQNVMIVDSSALTEQVVRDAIRSAFNSAGQRCSALRVVYIQEEVAQKTIAVLSGAMAELRIGEPSLLATDIGPVIDQDALDGLKEHVARMESEATLICRLPLPPETANGTYLAPHAFELESLRQLDREVFGPVLHVIRFRRDRLDEIIADINATGYGLTLGIHSRIDETVGYIRDHARVGNIYVNRDMIGAAVGVQPFGGQGLSGTGPKAGGPHYLQRFSTECTFTVNTAAIGGNAALLASGNEK